MSEQEQHIIQLREIIKKQEEDKVLLKKIWKCAKEMSEDDVRQGEEKSCENLLDNL